jgi:PAS domain S-box-containing protein
VTCKDGSQKTVMIFGSFVSGKVFVMFEDVSERKRVEEALRESEASLREAQDIARMGRWEFDLLSGHLHWSDGIFALFEATRDDFAASYEAFLAFVHPADRVLVDQVYRQSVAQKIPYDLEHRLLMPDGRIKWVSEIGRTTYDAAGIPIRSVGTVQDITERKVAEERISQALQEKEVLLREIHHRVKNNLQIIHSLLNLQAKGIADPGVRALFEESRDRVNAMALIHTRLYRTEDLAQIDFREYLESLVRSVAATYNRTGVTLVVKMEPLLLDVNLGIPCGLIVNELVANSLRHAFPEGRGGTVQVGVSRDDNGRYLLTVADDGIGLSSNLDAVGGASMGLKLVQILAGQLGAVMTLETSAGTSFCFDFAVATHLTTEKLSAAVQ